jgi:hypothetical protein
MCGFLFFNRLVYDRTEREIKAVNIIKGIDRISLLIAIIALIPGFYYGRIITNETLKAVSHVEYTEVIPLNPKRTYSYSPPTYKYPPMWQSLTGGIVIAFSGSFVVLFGIRGIPRLLIWIVDGFRNEKK